MGLLDRLRRRSPRPDDPVSPMPTFQVRYGEETTFTLPAPDLALLRSGQGERSVDEQHTVLSMLAEEGRAVELPDGYVLTADEVVALDADEAAFLRLPPRFDGTLTSSVHRWTTSPDFAVHITARTGTHPESHERHGPALVVGERTFLLSPPALRALRAVETHAALPREQRTEARNVRLVAQLQAARRAAAASPDPAVRDPHLALDLQGLEKFTTVVPAAVALAVEPQDDGSLVVAPDLGAGLDPAEVVRRWGRLGDPQDGRPTDEAVLRVGDRLVLLDGERLAGMDHVMRRPRIPAERAQEFLDAPGAFYDPDVVDVDVRLSVRVKGVGILAPLTFAEAAQSGIGWFDSVSTVASPDALVARPRTLAEHDALQEEVAQAWDRGDDVLTVDRTVVDVSDRSRVEEVLRSERDRLVALGVDVDDTAAHDPDDDAGPTGNQVTVGMHLHEADDVAEALRDRAHAAVVSPSPAVTGLARSPLPHQLDGIAWLTGLLRASLDGPDDDPARVRGALLADDMGLGKTFMTLVALRELLRAQRERDEAPLPVLAVMPVALLENWLAEIEETFVDPPFDNVVVLHGTGLAGYRQRGAGAETQATIDDLDENGMVRPDRLVTALRVGEEHGDARLDRPGTLVLTTYDTLRRYQVSLGQVRWGSVVLDEAQQTKNPEILVTRAAKALQARFTLLVTGTPVENSLRDFWCLVDTAQPGLLGRWSEFREEWVVPMDGADPDEQARLGLALRDAVGPFMLRRVKEDHLADLPPKTVHTGEHRTVMPSVQVDAYDGVLADFRAGLAAGVRGAALGALGRLGTVSLHPHAGTGDVIRADVGGLDESARLHATIRILDAVRDAEEKAIVFVSTKTVQVRLAGWLRQRYGVPVSVVNGDTAAAGSGSTRLSVIREFEARPGFGVIVMSPLAVGVGLTVVGANHAIHLERHWNPAKEAQATDRVYRIGQRRPVHVYHPMALHPDVDSFDVNLDRLLRRKTQLKDAVVVPGEVTQDEVLQAMGLE